jgi:hypothetical protein
MASNDYIDASKDGRLEYDPYIIIVFMGEGY